MLLYGSLVIATLGVAGAWFSGRHATRVVGCALALVATALCLPYNVVTGQYGFAVSIVVLTVVRYRALVHARRERTPTDVAAHRCRSCAR